MSLGLNDIKKKTQSKKAQPPPTQPTQKSIKKKSSRPWSRTGLDKASGKRKASPPIAEADSKASLYDMDETVARSTGHAADAGSLIHRIIELALSAEAYLREKRNTICAIRSKFVGPRAR